MDNLRPLEIALDFSDALHKYQQGADDYPTNLDDLGQLQITSELWTLLLGVFVCTLAAEISSRSWLHCKEALEENPPENSPPAPQSMPEHLVGSSHLVE